MRKLITILLILISCKCFSQEDLPAERIIKSDTVRVFIIYADTVYITSQTGIKFMATREEDSPKGGELLWQMGYRVKQILDNGFSIIGVELLLDRNKKHFTDNYAIFDYRLLK